jgi:lipoprotein-releasing system permease protein
LKFPFYIAWRYLFARKSHNLINILSAISVSGLIIGTMSMVIVLSVMNGFESIITKMYNSFNPDFRIEAIKGKTIDLSTFPIDKIVAIKGVANYSAIIEENALLRYKNKQQIVTIKGVDQNFTKVSNIKSKVVEGKYLLQMHDANFMVIGYGIYDKMEMGINDFKSPISVYIPKRDNTVTLDPTEAFNSEQVFASGAFSIQEEFDTKYAIIPLRLAKKLLDYKNEVTAIEIAISNSKNSDKIQKQIKQFIGDNYQIKNRYEQQEILYKIIKSEKFAIFLILSFIILIAAFNLIGSISMLILEKKKDIVILRSLGASENLIQQIFLAEGLLISLAGAFLGLVLGGLISFIQQQFGIIRLQGSGTFIIDAYPVVIQMSDFLKVALIVTVIGFIAAWFPINKIKKRLNSQIMDN